MSLVLAGVYDKVQKLAPDKSGAWSQTHVYHMVHIADLAIREEGSTLWLSEDIELQPNASYYDLPEDCIDVRSVQYTLDGTNWEYLVEPCTYTNLDNQHLRWSEDRNTKPEWYTLLSAPGTVGFSQIVIWPALSSVDSSQKIRVNHVGCYPDYGLSIAAADVPEWVQDKVYLPYVLALLYAPINTDVAEEFWVEFRRGIKKVKAAYAGKYQETPERVSSSWKYRP